MKAILKACHIENCVRVWSRHTTPRAFTHICLSGPTVKATYNAINPAATGLFVFNHPTLGDWSAVPSNFKTPDGTPLHQFAGLSTISEDPSWTDEYPVIEIFVLGHIKKFVNGIRRNGKPFCGIQIDDTALLDSIKPAAVPYRSDTMQWGDVDDSYKLPNGKPRADPDDVQETAIIVYTE